MAADLQMLDHLLAEYVQEVCALMPLRRAVLYGSYAVGTQGPNSDVDICFFVDDAAARTRRHEFLTTLFAVAAKYSRKGNVLIEPNVFPADEIDNDNPFVNEVLKTGRTLTIS